MDSLLVHLRTLARANRLANHRLHGACLELSDADFTATRTSFFPSLWATLNHVLIVDFFYVAALHREADMRAAFRSETPHATARELAAAQRACDERLIAWCDRADEAAIDAVIDIDRGRFIQRERADHLLMHLFTHQIHHRGQAHAMMSGTAVKPPPLDEFLMPSEALLRERDLAELGWTEDTLFQGGGLSSAEP